MQHIKIKPGVPLAEQAEIGHNRWHPDLPFLTSVKPGEEILIECEENLYKYYDTKFFKFLFLNKRRNQDFLQQTLNPFKYSPDICDRLSEVYKASAPQDYYKKVPSEGE